MKNIILFLFLTLSIQSFSQPILLRTEFKDETTSKCLSQELKRLINDYKVEGTFGFIKTVIKSNPTEFEETTSIYYKDEKGEVYDSMVEARYIPISQISSPNQVKYEAGFDLNGQSHFHNNKAIATLFSSTKDEKVILIKLLKQNPINYGGRIENNCYESSFIVPVVWWYEKGKYMNKNDLTNYLSTHFRKEN